MPGLGVLPIDELEDQPREHGGRVRDAVDVEEDLVALVRRQHLGVRDAAAQRRLIDLRPLIVLVVAMRHAVKDVQVEIQGRAQDGGGCILALEVTMVVPGSRETDRPAARAGQQRIVQPGLRGERQGENPAMADVATIVINAIRVRGEDEVEQPRRIDEEFEVRRVLLVVEHRGDGALATPRDHVGDRIV